MRRALTLAQCGTLAEYLKLKPRLQALGFVGFDNDDLPVVRCHDQTRDIMIAVRPDGSGKTPKNPVRWMEDKEIERFDQGHLELLLQLGMLPPTTGGNT